MTRFSFQKVTAVPWCAMSAGPRVGEGRPSRRATVCRQDMAALVETMAVKMERDAKFWKILRSKIQGIW